MRRDRSKSARGAAALLGGSTWNCAWSAESFVFHFCLDLHRTEGIAQSNVPFRIWIWQTVVDIVSGDGWFPLEFSPPQREWCARRHPLSAIRRKDRSTDSGIAQTSARNEALSDQVHPNPLPSCTNGELESHGGHGGHGGHADIGSAIQAAVPMDATSDCGIERNAQRTRSPARLFEEIACRDCVEFYWVKSELFTTTLRST
jgi:hypothetical protein